jgi:uncharacterized protein (TIGR04255 family)
MDYPISNSFPSGELPSFKKPPVNEVVCGMLFHTLEKLRIPHIGLLWDKFRRDYPIIHHAPPIASTKGELLVDSSTSLPIPRVWFIKKSDDQLVQFQFDRFYFNWRRRQNDYPRYSNVIKNFEKTHDIIMKFFNEFEIGKLEPIECELSYINHIPKDQVWNTIDDTVKIFPDFVWRQISGRFLSNPEKVTWQSSYPLQKAKGNLNVSLKQAIRNEDKVPLLILELTARGIGESTNKDGIREWFDVAHEYIVRGFVDLTTPEVQKVWERENNE